MKEIPVCVLLVSTAKAVETYSMGDRSSLSSVCLSGLTGGSCRDRHQYRTDLSRSSSLIAFVRQVMTLKRDVLVCLIEKSLKNSGATCFRQNFFSDSRPNKYFTVKRFYRILSVVVLIFVDRVGHWMLLGHDPLTSSDLDAQWDCICVDFEVRMRLYVSRGFCLVFVTTHKSM